MNTALRVKGSTLHVPACGRAALAELHQARNGLAELPVRIWAAAERKEGRLLLWPAFPLDLDAYPLRVSPGGRQVALRLPDLLAELNLRLPPGIVVAVPYRWQQTEAYGWVLALPFREGVFLYRNSHGSAIGLLDS